jgi:hypothetical protein
MIHNQVPSRNIFRCECSCGNQYRTRSGLTMHMKARNLAFQVSGVAQFG